jgi:hypothetical protein
VPTTKENAVFGGADGVVASAALVLATYPHGPKVVVVALLGLLIAEGLGMAASEYLSDSATDLKQAAVMGIATSLAIIGPGIPWLITRGSVALTASVAIALGIAGVIAQVRSGGLKGWLTTFGVLVVVGGIATIAGHWA